MSLFYSSPFDDAVEKATSEMIPRGDENMVLNFEICDQIRSKLVSPKDAALSLQKRLGHANPNVVIHTLNLLDTCIKNGGVHFLTEIASTDFVNHLTHMVRTGPPAVTTVLLPLLQLWALAFQNKPNLQLMHARYLQLKNEGVPFPPPLSTPDVLIETSVAPEWTDSSHCERCRTLFTLTNRKHHCRACGRTYCGQCSSNSTPLVHFGISEPVRVCDGCFAGISAKGRADKKVVTHVPVSPGSDVEKHEQEQLERAIALSLAESTKLPPSRSTPKSTPATNPQYHPSNDPDLEAAIAASIADLKIQNTNRIPVAHSPPLIQRVQSPTPTAGLEKKRISDDEMDMVHLFTSNMERLQQMGLHEGSKALVNNREYGALFQSLTKMNSRLDVDIHETLAVHNQLQEMHDRVTQCLRIYEDAVDVRIRGTTAMPPSNYPGQHSMHSGGAVVDFPRPIFQAPLYHTNVATIGPPSGPVADLSATYPPLNYPPQSPANYPQYTGSNVPPTTYPPPNYPSHTDMSTHFSQQGPAYLPNLLTGNEHQPPFYTPHPPGPPSSNHLLTNTPMPVAHSHYNYGPAVHGYPPGLAPHSGTDVHTNHGYPPPQPTLTPTNTTMPSQGAHPPPQPTPIEAPPLIDLS